MSKCQWMNVRLYVSSRIGCGEYMRAYFGRNWGMYWMHNKNENNYCHGTTKKPDKCFFFFFFKIDI